MINELIQIYGNDLLMVFEPNKLKEGKNTLAIIRSDVSKKEIPNVLTMNYEEDFESLLAYPVPAKTRKPTKLLSYQKTLEVLERNTFGSLGVVINGMPYTFGLDYVVVEGHIYFHTGRKGYKLNALGTLASFSIIEDLGPAYNGTHNFRSIMVNGPLNATEDYEIKKKVLLKLINHINPNHAAYIDEMQKNTLVFEIENDWMVGRENLYLPGDGK